MRMNYSPFLSEPISIYGFPRSETYGTKFEEKALINVFKKIRNASTCRQEWRRQNTEVNDLLSSCQKVNKGLRHANHFPNT